MKKTMVLILAGIAFLVGIQLVYSQAKPTINWEQSIDSGWSTSILSVTPLGDILASSNSNYTNLLARLSNKGEPLWTLPYGSSKYGDTLPIDTRYIDEYQGSTRMLGLRLWDIFYGSGWLIQWEINSQGVAKQWCCDWKMAQPTYGQPNGILPANNGGMYLSGTVSGGIKEDFDKVYFTKTDSSGVGIVKVYNDIKVDTGDAQVVVHSFYRMPDGGFVISGDINYFKKGGARDVFILRIDSLGNKLWTKNYGTTSVETLGRVISTNDGGFLLTCNSLHFGDGQNFGVYCIKIDSVGTIQWEQSYLEPNYYSNFPNYCIQTKDKNFMIVGRVNGGNTNGQGDCYILKIDSMGMKQWSYTFGSPDNDYLESVAELPNGSLVVGGRNNGKMYVAELSFPTIGVQEVSLPTLWLNSTQLQSGETIVHYSLPSFSTHSLKLFNSIGGEIEELSGIAEQKGGEYSITLPLDKLPTGVYFIQLTDGKNTITKTLTVIR